MRVLVTISGQDRPGITSEISGILSRSQAQILDMGQAVIHGWLSLSILFESSGSKESGEDSGESALKDILFSATRMGLRTEFQLAPPEASTRTHDFSYAVTLLGEGLSACSVHEVSAHLAKFSLNIDRIQRLSDARFNWHELLALANTHGIDIALQAEGLFRRSKRLVVFDMDSTLIEHEVIDEFAREMDSYEAVSDITHRAMKGELSYDESLHRRCAFLKGLTLQQVDRVFQRLKLTDGARELMATLRRMGYRTAIVSGGFSCISERLRDELKMDAAYSNQMEFERGVFTGRVLPPIVNAQRKADLLDAMAQQERIQLDQVVAVGDGANDLLMLEKAGLGIAFNAKPIVNERADFALRRKNLASILYLLGLSSRDIVQM